jgi:chromosome partitioning protein
LNARGSPSSKIYDFVKELIRKAANSRKPESMKTIVVASQKGGSGKTTLAAHLAVTIERSGCGPAVLIDLDPQATLSGWWNRREAQTPACAAAASLATLSDKLAELAEAGFAWAVIDTPPAIGATNRLAIAAADLVVIPTRASPHDLNALGSTLEIVQAASRPFVFVLNSAKPGTAIATQAVALLSEYGPVCPAVIGDRVMYASSMSDGSSIGELDPTGKGAVELGELLEFVKSRFPEFRKVKVKQYA